MDTTNIKNYYGAQNDWMIPRDSTTVEEVVIRSANQRNQHAAQSTGEFIERKQFLEKKLTFDQQLSKGVNKCVV